MAAGVEPHGRELFAAAGSPVAGGGNMTDMGGQHGLQRLPRVVVAGELVPAARVTTLVTLSGTP